MPARCHMAFSCLGAPTTALGDTRRRARTSGHAFRGVKLHVTGRLGRPGQEYLWSASQIKPSPLAAGIQYHEHPRKISLARCPPDQADVMVSCGRAVVSQGVSLFPRNAIASLFLPVLKHAVLASVCSLKCQVHPCGTISLSPILKGPSFRVCSSLLKKKVAVFPTLIPTITTVWTKYLNTWTLEL